MNQAYPEWNRRVAITVLIVAVGAMVAVTAAVFVPPAIKAILPSPPGPNGLVFTGVLREEREGVIFTGVLKGPALFELRAKGRVECMLTVNAQVDYHSNCRRFTYRLEIEQRFVFSFEILNATFVPTGYEARIAAAAGHEDIQTVDAFDSIVERRFILPDPGLPARPEEGPVNAFHLKANWSTSMPNPTFLIKVPEYLDVTVNVSFSMGIKITVRDVLIVSGSDCQGATSARVRQVGFQADLDVTITIDPRRVSPLPVEVEFWFEGPGITLVDDNLNQPGR